MFWVEYPFKDDKKYPAVTDNQYFTFFTCEKFNYSKLVNRPPKTIVYGYYDGCKSFIPKVT